MCKKNICIVIPIYKPELTANERMSIQIVQERLKCFDLFFVTYPELDLFSYRKFKSMKVVYFSRKYFESTKTYNKLLLNPFFYLKFIKYQYLCIVQTDVVILGNAEQLERFSTFKYDYWGAPWKTPYLIHRFEPERHFDILDRYIALKRQLMGKGIWCNVGNGGLSLRNVKKTIRILLKHSISRHFWYKNEDAFFSFYGIYDKKNYKIAPVRQARKFSLESTVLDDIRKSGMPFGIHAWEKYYPDLLIENKNIERSNCM